MTYSDDGDAIEVAVDLDTPTVIDMEEGKGRVVDEPRSQIHSCDC